jgi:phage shock protein C
MFCTECGFENRAEDRFCSRCGRKTAAAGPDAPAPAAEWGPPRRLMMDKRNKKIAGVCAGFARYMDADPTLVRVLWLILAFGFGAGFIGYLIAWIVMPSDHGDSSLAL